MKSITRSYFLTFYLPLILFLCAIVFAAFKRFPDFQNYGNILFSIGTIFGSVFFLTIITKYRWRKVALANLYGCYLFVSLGIILGFKGKEFLLGRYLGLGMIIISIAVMSVWIFKSREKLKTFLVLFGSCALAATFVYTVRLLAKYLNGSGLI